MASGDDEERLFNSVVLQDADRAVVERQRVERELSEERERLRITLASIGDGVISTDCDGRVVFLNAVAEALTGWPQADAAGQALTTVFHILNEATRLPVDNPALRAMEEGGVVDLANHTVLVARDGTERPIDDSAAPMRSESGSTIGAVLVFRDVSERRRATVAQAQLAAIVKSSEDAILSKTIDGVVLSWNAGAERIFGYTAEEAVGQPITFLIPPERMEEETHILSQVRRGVRVEPFETVRVTKDGRRLDISLTVSPLRDEAGRIVGASKIGRDVTARKRTEEALREREGRHRFLVDLAAAVQPLTDADEVMETTARILAEHLGVDGCAYAEVEDEATFVVTGDYARGVPSIVGRWPVAGFGAECERCMSANEPYIVHDVEADDHTRSDLEAYRQANVQAAICVPLHKAGKFAAAMAVQQKTPRTWTSAEIELVRTVVARSWESLERTRVERGLKETADRLALALAAANLGDWSWDARTDMATLAPTAAEMFGIPPGTVMTWTAIQSILHPDDREQTRDEVNRALATGDQYDVEFRVLRPGAEEMWVSAKGRAQYDPSGSALGMFGVVQDITERKRQERNLRLRAAELAEADRKKNEFIALLAHELRNPLAPVRTGLEVMRLAAGDENTVAQAREMMDRQLAHMVRLIDDLLDVSRISRHRLNLMKTRVLLSEVVKHALETARPAIVAAGHELEVSLPAEPVTFVGDLTRLAQVFGNLLTNSAKYTEKGGRIWLRAEVRGSEALVTVSDTGIGIPTDALPRVFDMFSQVDRTIERVTGGLGIGLALVKGLVETHGGSVAAESSGPGCGSTFSVRLPIARSPSTPASADATGATPTLPPRRKVLVADDNRDGAEAMATLLELLGSEVHVAHDGIEAVEVAERVRPDLVLMDIGMPRLNGLDATRQIRARPWARSVTIIALTGWGQESDRTQSRAAGCDGHLVKPIGIPQLEAVLAAEPPVTPDVT
jgi:PAS domain S-box-containing protein